LVSKKFGKVPRLAAWEPPTYNALEVVAKGIEDKYGRLDPVLFKGDVEKFAAQKEEVLAYVEEGKHHRESAELNFSSLADPFGPYLFRIKPDDILDEEREDAKKIDAAVLEAASKKNFGGKLDDVDEEDKKSYLKREIERYKRNRNKIIV